MLCKHCILSFAKFEGSREDIALSFDKFEESCEEFEEHCVEPTLLFEDGSCGETTSLIAELEESAKDMIDQFDACSRYIRSIIDSKCGVGHFATTGEYVCESIMHEDSESCREQVRNIKSKIDEIAETMTTLMRSKRMTIDGGQG